MPYAITLCPDAGAAAPIAAMWRALSEAGLHDDSLALGYPPHVTLSIHPDTVDPARLEAAMAATVAQAAGIDLRPAAFGLFPAPVQVLILAPVVTPALLALQGSLADALSGLPCDPHYRSGSWVPHITLAKGGAAGEPGWMGRALDCLGPLWSSLRPGAAERLELVHFRPVTVLRSLVIPRGLARPATSV